MKTCNKCKMEKPATPEYFHRNKANEGGLEYTCKECKKKYNKRRYRENKEDKREYNKKYREENEEYYREYLREYYEENKEHHAEYGKKYRQENPEVSRRKSQRRRARMAKLPHTLTVEEWEKALEFFNHSCAYCGVSDDNIGKEHVIPIVKGGGYTADNIIPACRTCNSSKNTTDMEKWYLSYRHYDKEKLNKILDYIEVITE